MKDNTKMKENMKKELNLEDLEQVAGGKNLEEMSLQELNNLIKMYERQIDVILKDVKDHGVDDSMSRGNHGGMAAARKCLDDIIAVKERRFG